MFIVWELACLSSQPMLQVWRVGRPLQSVADKRSKGARMQYARLSQSARRAAMYKLLCKPLPWTWGLRDSCGKESCRWRGSVREWGTAGMVG